MPLKFNKGFTLVELLVAISIVAVIGAIGVVTYSTTQKTGRISKRVQDLKAISEAIELYKIQTGSYPLRQPTFACFGGLVLTPAITPTYMKVVPADPLDNGNSVNGTFCYQYLSTTDAKEYKIRTNPTIQNSASNFEMNTNDFLQQPGLIDPTKDDNGPPDCNVNASALSIQGWAIYSGTTACGF